MKLFGRREPDLVERLTKAKGLIERGFTPSFYEMEGFYCAVGAYAKTFGRKRTPIYTLIAKVEVNEGITLLNEATFIITGGEWEHIENMAMRLHDKDLVLKAYDKAIELAKGRIAKGLDPIYGERSGGSNSTIGSIAMEPREPIRVF